MLGVILKFYQGNIVQPGPSDVYQQKDQNKKEGKKRKKVQVPNKKERSQWAAPVLLRYPQVMPLAELTKKKQNIIKKIPNAELQGKAYWPRERPDFPSSSQKEKEKEKDINRVIIASIHHPVLQSTNAHAEHLTRSCDQVPANRVRYQASIGGSAIAQL
jgi:hypothetical protein